MTVSPDIWIASFETRSTVSRAVGATPEQALKAMVSAWVTRHCPLTGAEPSLPWDERDEVVLNGGSLGEGYVLGASDGYWFPRTLSGGDDRFADLWSDLADELKVAIASPGPSRG